MRICVFLGSPRKKGHTAHLLNLIIEGIEDAGHKIELIYLQDKKISGCIECFACQKVINKPGCSIKDDMQQLYLKIFSADCIIIASPVFCLGFSAQTKAFLDRWYCLIKSHRDGSFYTSLIEGKKCGLIVTAGDNAFDGADLVVESYKRIVEGFKMKSIGHIVATNIKTINDITKPGIRKIVMQFCKKWHAKRRIF